MATTKIIVTDTGRAKFALANATGTSVKLKDFAVGDANGVSYIPTGVETKLVNENWRTNISSIKVNANDNKVLDVDAVIPEGVGGWYIREYGIFDEDNNLILIATMNEVYKSTIDDGESVALAFNLNLNLQNTSSVEFIIESKAFVTHDYLKESDYTIKSKIEYEQRPIILNSEIATLADLRIFTVGDLKYSLQNRNHSAGVHGEWIKCDGQSLEINKHNKLFELLQNSRIALSSVDGFHAMFNIPDYSGRVLSASNLLHPSGELLGADEIRVPIPEHEHTMFKYNGHIHNDDHSHKDDHTHGDYGHGHVGQAHNHSILNTRMVGQQGHGGSGPVVSETVERTDWTSSVSIGVNSGFANLNLKSQAGYGLTTISKSQSGYGVNTGVVASADSRTDLAGIKNAVMSVLQPTVFIGNIFIYSE